MQLFKKEKKNHGSRITALIISNEEMEGIVKLVKFLEESRLLIKGYNETIKNEGKEEKEGFLHIILGRLAASISGNAITGKELIRAGQNF